MQQWFHSIVLKGWMIDVLYFPLSRIGPCRTIYGGKAGWNRWTGYILSYFWTRLVLFAAYLESFLSSLLTARQKINVLGAFLLAVVKPWDPLNWWFTLLRNILSLSRSGASLERFDAHALLPYISSTVGPWLGHSSNASWIVCYKAPKNGLDSQHLILASY